MANVTAGVGASVAGSEPRLTALANATALDQRKNGLFDFGKLAPLARTASQAFEYDKTDGSMQVGDFTKSSVRAAQTAARTIKSSTTRISGSTEELSVQYKRDVDLEIARAAEIGAANPLTADARAAVIQVMTERYYNVAQLGTDASITNLTTISDAAEKWDKDTSDPIGNVKTVTDLLLAAVAAPMSMIVGVGSRSVIYHLQNHSQLREYSKYTGHAPLSVMQVAAALQIKEVIPIDVLGKNSSDEYEYALGNRFVLMVVDPTQPTDPIEAGLSAFKWVQWTGGGVGAEGVRMKTWTESEPNVSAGRAIITGKAVIVNANAAGAVVTPLT